jgi:hypothetical protein
MREVDRLPHGYTNLTRRLPGGRIEKRFEGFDRFDRAEREHACLVHLARSLPVPTVVARDATAPLLIVTEAVGTHGQEMLRASRAGDVLRLLGKLLYELQQLPPASVPGLSGRGTVVVHGDFGPQNVLVHGGRVSALLDWEFAHIGQPVEDLAWAEWIVRMHHPDTVEAISELHGAAQRNFGWLDRQAAMAARCEELLRYSEAAGSTEAVDLWRDRLRMTELWTE